MTTSIEHPPAGVADETAARAADHLWMHFARQGRHPEVPVPVVTRGEGAYPVAAALSPANLDLMENERLNQRVLQNEAALGRLTDLPIVGDALFDNGLYCRPDDRGDVVVQVAPPLICGQAEFDEMEQVLRHTLTEAQKLI